MTHGTLHNSPQTGSASGSGFCQRPIRLSAASPALRPARKSFLLLTDPEYAARGRTAEQQAPARAGVARAPISHSPQLAPGSVLLCTPCLVASLLQGFGGDRQEARPCRDPRAGAALLSPLHPAPGSRCRAGAATPGDRLSRVRIWVGRSPGRRGSGRGARLRPSRPGAAGGWHAGRDTF